MGENVIKVFLNVLFWEMCKLNGNIILKWRGDD